MGYFGREKIISLIRDRFYWYGMMKDIEYFIFNCRRCFFRKILIIERVLFINIKILQFLEFVCVDYLKLEKLKGGYENVLVIIDYFICYVQVIVMRN